MKNILKSMSVILIAFSCSQLQTASYDSFGESIDTNGTMDVSSFLSEVDDSNKNFKVEGIAEEVCQMKGCWLTLRNEEGSNIRVTFKDYGFFVPKDISGRKVIIEGEALKEVLEEDVAKHYADDSGKEYDESMRNSVSFVAKGILVAKS